MQKKILCAVLAAVMTFSLTGCFGRKNDRDPSSQGSSAPSSQQKDDQDDGGVISDIGDGVSDAVSDIGEGASDIVSDIEEGADDLMGDDDIHDGDGDVLDDGLNDSEDLNDESSDGTSPARRRSLTSHTMPEGSNGVTASLSVETAVTALSSEKQGWGQGVQLNDKNQPLSALSFQDRYGKYDAHFIGPDEPVVYLTFDCGYENGHTAGILDTLKEKNVRAVFFVTMDYIRSEPELIRRMIDEGHIIGNHSDKHPSFPEIDTARREQEIKNVENYLAEQFGYTGMNLFRPPAGEFSEQILAEMQSLGYKTVFWSYAYKDWDPDAQMGADKALTKLNGALHNGAIYLLHAVSSDNEEILGDFIDHTRQKGYDFALFG